MSRSRKGLEGNLTCTWIQDSESVSSSVVFSACPMMMLADSAVSHMWKGLNCVKDDFYCTLVKYLIISVRYTQPQLTVQRKSTWLLPGVKSVHNIPKPFQMSKNLHKGRQCLKVHSVYFYCTFHSSLFQWFGTLFFTVYMCIMSKG